MVDVKLLLRSVSPWVTMVDFHSFLQQHPVSQFTPQCQRCMWSLQNYPRVWWLCTWVSDQLLDGSETSYVSGGKDQPSCDPCPDSSGRRTQSREGRRTHVRSPGGHQRLHHPGLGREMAVPQRHGKKRLRSGGLRGPRGVFWMRPFLANIETSKERFPPLNMELNLSS
jgi:hypothetical protein